MIIKNVKVFTEDKTFRIDRLMIKMPNEKTKGTVYIVDYKTGETDEEQIENYRHLIEKLLEERKMLDQFEIITEFIEFKLQKRKYRIKDKIKKIICAIKKLT